MLIIWQRRLLQLSLERRSHSDCRSAAYSLVVRGTGQYIDDKSADRGELRQGLGFRRYAFCACRLSAGGSVPTILLLARGGGDTLRVNCPIRLLFA